VRLALGSSVSLYGNALIAEDAMARQLRIQYEGAFYHVYSRGNQKQPIFLSDDDLYFFQKILGDVHEKYDVWIHVYCLMKNHYHLILQTMLANLSRVMQFLNTKYAAYLNAKHGRCGHLFQGRYKAILVHAEAYAQILSKYIHENPVKKRMVKTPEEYPWSSCREYLGLQKPPRWLRTSYVLRLFADEPVLARSRYEDYLRSEATLPDPELVRASRLGILGGAEFIEKIRGTYLKDAMAEFDEQVPQVRRLKKKPALREILDLVTDRLGPNNRLARRSTIYLAHKNTDYRLKEIGAFFDIGPTAVSIAFRKMREELSGNSSIARAVSEIEAQLFPRSRKE
jgi:putative transposase